MKVRVYKTPTKTNPNKVAVGIPQSVQADSTISELNVVQQEILPAPVTLTDLFVTPNEIPNASISGFKNVGVSALTPGYRMVVTPIGLKDTFVPPMEVEEITIPDGYVHLDDASDWDIFNYNRAYTLTDRNFDVLPGYKRLPMELRWDLVHKEKVFRARYRAPVDGLRVYYRRISTVPQDFEWVDWAFVTDDPVPFPYFGKYAFRAVPYHLGKPLPFMKEWEYEWEESDTLSWSAIQLAEDSYQVRLEGVLGQTINEVQAFENKKCLGIFPLTINPEGRTEKTLTLTGISKSKSPTIEYRFMRKVGQHRSLVFKSSQVLDRNYAKEPVELKVRRSGDGFKLTITDEGQVLYSPVNALDPFTGTQWDRAIQTKKLIVKLEIIRHQDGETRPYGSYFLNITSESNPNFLDSPPFGDGVTRVSGGFQFEFEDTPTFRDIANLDNPDTDKRLAYEFRLIYWTAGVENCLRTGSDYLFPKEVSFSVRNKRSSYKFSYSVWREEHPRRKYLRIIPRDVEYKYLNDHIRFGRSPKGIVMQSTPRVTIPTRGISVEDPVWKVLYYYNDSDDELVEFPYTSFDITVPTSSQLAINSLEVTIEKESGEVVSLGEYHPADVISIVDFLGYYEARKMITKRTNFKKAFATLGDLSKPANQIKRSKPILESKKLQAEQNQVFSSMTVNTQAKRIDAMTANRQINNAVAKQVEGGTLLYKIKINYIDLQIGSEPVSISISDRPSIPEEPEDNSSFSIGNKTVLPSTFAVPTSAVSTITSQVQQVASPIKTTNKIGFNR